MPSLKSKEKLLWFFGIFFYSIVVFCILLAKNVDSFYSDDNAMQWGPVARPAFDRLFETGRIPYWDFYQYKGIDIFSSGYYGLTNPFMYISYFISRFIFSYSVDMLTIYEWPLLARILDDVRSAQKAQYSYWYSGSFTHRIFHIGYILLLYILLLYFQ